MSFRITNSQTPLIQSDNNVSENKNETLSENATSLESLVEKAISNDGAAAKGEHHLAGLARQIGLFKYALPNDSANMTTMATGEEDGGIKPNPQPDKGTTLALGEEDGGLPKEPGGMTTMATGEEDGGIKPNPQPESGFPKEPGGMTTMATGEEDGGIKPNPQPSGATTFAVGEEDGGLNQPGGFTTMAIGEED
jgi:hypothetical protein